MYHKMHHDSRKGGKSHIPLKYGRGWIRKLATKKRHPSISERYLCIGLRQILINWCKSGVKPEKMELQKP